MIGGEDELVLLAVQRDDDLSMYEVIFRFGGETHFDTKAVAEAAMEEYASAIESAVADHNAEAERKAGYELAIAALRRIAKEPGSELGTTAANWLDAKSTRAHAFHGEAPQAVTPCPKCRHQQLLVDREPGGPAVVCPLCFWEAHVDKPFLIDPKRCIVIPRPERHISTVKIFKNMHMVKFCVPCRVYTTISACPCCNAPTLASGRPPGEDAGVRARREQERRDSTPALKPMHGSVSDTPDGSVIDVDAEEVGSEPTQADVDRDRETVAEFQRAYADASDPPSRSPLDYPGSPVPGLYGPGALAIGGYSYLAHCAVKGQLPDSELADPEDCQRCSECEHQTHHWEIDAIEADEEEEGDDSTVWGCKHCDVQFPIVTSVPEVDHALHTEVQPEMLPARTVAAMVSALLALPSGSDVRIQLRMPDDSWHTIERHQEYDSDHLLLLVEKHGFARRHKNEHMSWRLTQPAS